MVITTTLDSLTTTTSTPPPLASPTYPLGYRAAMIWLRAEAPYTSHSLYKVGESLSAPATRLTRGFRADYGFIETLDREIRQDINEIYVRLGKAHDERSLMSGRLNLLQRDRRAHAHIALLMEREARLSLKDKGRSMDASDLAHSETQVTALQGQLGPLSGPAQPEISEEADSSS
ncbi:hypothetical protein Tco_1337252 [Tanacetum coccineum]